MRSRDEIHAELAPIRHDMIRISEHLNDEHGIRPDARETTAPQTIVESGRSAGWAKRYGGGLSLPADRDEQIRVIMAEQEVCSLSGCPGLDALQRAYENARTKRDALRDELPDIVKPGAVQTVQPKGLDATALIGVMSRHG